MRVALISHNAAAGDAIGRQVAARAAFFRDRGARVQVFVESDRRLHPELQVCVATPTPALIADLRHCDLIIIDYGQYYRLLDVLPDVAGRGPRILFDYHGITPPELWDGPVEALREGRARLGLVWYADQAIVHSEFMRRDLCAATNYPAERVHVQPLWFDPASAAMAPNLETKLGLSEERLLLFVGRLAANKRVPVLIEALAHLKDERPAYHAAIIGDGGDLYRRQLERCQRLAAEHGIQDRVHFLGRVSDAELAGAYRSADLFVMPSVHEGCCLPVLEAMAAGLPVIAARAAALPETIAGVGRSFRPDDPADLARQIREVFRSEGNTTPQAAKRVAVVAPRYGDGVLGGAERSLRLIAEVLSQRGHQVEVFTTGHGDETLDGVRVHRFAADAIDESTLAPAIQALRQGGEVSNELLNDFFEQTKQSEKLLRELQRRYTEFDAIIVGPYGNGLTREVLGLRPERTLLVPCFHREPLAQQPALATLFARAGGLLFHSEAERRFAEIELGITHPNSAVIGTWLHEGQGDAQRGRRLVGERPYLLFAGRYCAEKNLPLLIDWARQYTQMHPDRVRFAFCGGGPVNIPDGPDWINLGYLSERDRADVFAGAAAVVQLSTNESLSLAALEAWAEGVPVIAHRQCDVLRDLITASSGGAIVGEFEQFRIALEDLWHYAERWRELGRRGRAFVGAHFASQQEFAERIEQPLAALDQPLIELMRHRGREKVAGHAEAWQRSFADRVESLLHAESIDLKEAATIEPRGTSLRTRLGARRVGLRLTNTGTAPLWPDGPRAFALCIEVRNSAADPVLTRLQQPLNPGQSILLSARLPLVGDPGEYTAECTLIAGDAVIGTAALPLRVDGKEDRSGDPLLTDLAARLVAAESLANLPAGYEDVSEGTLAGVKRAIKRKLLHQFQTAYVDVLSRQQSAMNRVMLSAIQELTECAALLGQERDTAPPTDLTAAVKRLKDQARRTAQRLDALERRLDALESNKEVRA